MVWDIRNELRGANGQMKTIETTMQDTHKRLDKLGVGIDNTDGSLGLLREQLKILREINEKLTLVDRQLKTTDKKIDSVVGRLDLTMPLLEETHRKLNETNTHLEPLATSLKATQVTLGKMDTKLLELHKGVKKLNKSMSILDFGDEEPAVLEEEAVAAPSETPAVAAAGAPSDKSKPSARASARSPLAGTWMLAHPAEVPEILVLLPSGAYLRAVKGKALERGAWKDASDKERKRLMLQENPGTRKKPDGTQVPVEWPEVEWSVLSSNMKSMTVETEGSVRVFVRP